MGFTCRGAAAAAGGAVALDFAGTAAEVALAFGFTAGIGPVTLCAREKLYGIHHIETMKLCKMVSKSKRIN